jgi:hypothetical protein
MSAAAFYIHSFLYIRTPLCHESSVSVLLDRRNWKRSPHTASSSHQDVHTSITRRGVCEL